MRSSCLLSLFFLCILSCFSCKDEQIPQEVCVSNFLSGTEMLPYTGQTWSDCRFFVHLYEHDGGHYFLMDNYCIDMIATPLDCDREPLCDEEDFANCNIFEGSVYVGIVGVGDI